MRYLVAVAAALAVLCSGCLKFGDKLGNDYTVFIDPAMEPNIQADVLEALDRWTGAVPVTFHPTVGHCDGVHDGMICLHQTDQAGVNAVADHPGEAGNTHNKHDLTHEVDGGEVWLLVYPNIGTEGFTRSVEHEIGHAMGLSHTNGADIMNPGQITVPTPSHTDVAQWWSFRID